MKIENPGLSGEILEDVDACVHACMCVKTQMKGLVMNVQSLHFKLCLNHLIEVIVTSVTTGANMTGCSMALMYNPSKGGLP